MREKQIDKFPRWVRRRRKRGKEGKEGEEQGKKDWKLKFMTLKMTVTEIEPGPSLLSPSLVAVNLAMRADQTKIGCWGGGRRWAPWLGWEVGGGVRQWARWRDKGRDRRKRRRTLEGGNDDAVSVQCKSWQLRSQQIQSAGCAGRGLSQLLWHWQMEYFQRT